ncbi:MAG: GNAT family N-acetyltransferase [Pseudomonadota bacterium]
MTPEAMATIHAASFSVGPRPWSAEEIVELAEQAGGILVTTGGGFAVGRVIAEEAELLTIAVDPDMRRQGTGATLLAAYHDRAVRAGAQVSVLEVAADNAAARALYDRAGYVLSGQRKRYYARQGQRGADALILTRPLP